MTSHALRSGGRRCRPVVVLIVLVAGCAPSTTPEQQVRAVIASGEAAAEKRDLAALMSHVSPRYEDDSGGSAVELERRLRGVFLAYPSVHVMTRIDRMNFPYRDMARLELTVGTLGRTAGGARTFDPAADVYEVALELKLERGQWMVTRASWRSVTHG